MPHPSQQQPADPTPLTTSQILREIAALEKLTNTRLDAMDKAVDLFSTNLTRVPTDVDKQVGNLRALHDEKISALRVEVLEHFSTIEERFRSIQVQFAERDTRTEQTSRDSKVAVDAALQAAKEAVGEQNKSSALAIAKSETATTKQIDQLVVLIQTTTNALNDKIDDLKGRLTLIEGKGFGRADATTDTHSSNNWTLALVLGGISIIGLVTNVLFDLLRK